MKPNRRHALVLLASGVITVSSRVLVAQETAGAGPALRVVQPAEGSVLSTREPSLQVCIAGGDGDMRSSFRATLDGETITNGFTWTGECAQWHPPEGWSGFDRPHSWSERRYDEEGWTVGLRDGDHAFEARVSGPGGTEVVVATSFSVRTKKRAMSLGVGFPDVSLEGFDGDFAPANLLEGRYGSRRVSGVAKDAGVLRYTAKDVSVAGISSSLAESADPGETETTLWRFSAGKRKGYGYKTGNTSYIAPYHGTAVFFGGISADEGPFGAEDERTFAPFDGETRLGSSFEGGIAFALNNSITLDAGFEETAVYPHWVFWEAAGSGAVHGLALCIADGVSRQVARTAPRAAPVVSFILRNGISYAIYHQRRTDVNWPFGGGQALIYKGVKVSFTFTY